MAGWTNWLADSRREYFCAFVLLLLHAAAQVYLAWEDSETIDEPAHLAAALTYTRNGTFRLYNVNPPFARMVQGAFLLGAPLDTTMIVEPSQHGERREMGVGEMFLDANEESYRDLLLLARMGTIVFSLVGGILVLIWGNLAFGRPCGILALTAWCCNPYVLANGHLATPDLPAATMAVAAAFALRSYLVAPSWSRSLVVGVTLGLAQLTKFTLLLLYPVWFLFWLFTVLRNPAQPRLLTGQGLFALAVSLLTLNAGYLFQDTGRRLETFRFVSTKLGSIAPNTVDSLHEPTNSLAGTWLGSVPVPLPAPYVEGIDLQARDFDRYARNKSSFLIAGKWVEGGRYYYYLYGLLVKTPLALFGLLAVAAVLLWRRPAGSIDMALLVIIPLAILVFVSSQKSMNKHIRYLLPMLPFVVVLAGAVGRSWQQERKWLRGFVVLLFAWLLFAGGRSLRDPVAYFNEAAGGPRGGVRLLAGTNVDWGQGRYRLRDWLEARPDFRLDGMACYATNGHVFAGMLCPLPPIGPGKSPIPDDLNEQRKLGPHPGRFAVSARVFQGDLTSVPDPTGKGHHFDGHVYTYFLRFEPVATAGDSVWIFDISLEEANRVRAELGLVALDEP
jgi:4-amino-4-deoxy-L-arabinose transferase-like glycosyltransferase